MKNYLTKNARIISVLISLLMVLSVISFPSLKASADGTAGTLDDFVERCYTVTLDRPSDEDGFNDWKNQLLNGKAVGAEIAYGFLFSKEYLTKDKDNDAYLNDLYMLFMGREPDEGGYNDWMGKLNSGASRLEVFAGFANSPEFYNLCKSYGITAGRYTTGYDRQTNNNVNLFVERMYKICLNRIGDKDGQANWVNKLVNKQITGTECARSFIFSTEYKNKGLTNDQFVENLYLAMFGRPSDEAGKAGWLAALESGQTRDQVFAGFANSAEFANMCASYNIDKGSYTAQDVYKPLRFRLKKESKSYGGSLVYEYKGDSGEEYTAYRYSQEGTLLGIESQIEKTENGERIVQASFDPNTGATSYIQKRESVWNTDKTKCVTTYYDELNGGVVTGYLEEFYENGRITKLRAYDKDHNLRRTAEYEYPEENRVISDDTSFTMDYRQIIDEKKYYDKNGVITKVETSVSYSKADGIPTGGYTVVDDYVDGNLISTVSINHENNDEKRISATYEYKDGKLYKDYDYNAIGEMDSWFLYEYNSKGLLIKKALYHSDNNLEAYGYIYEYDEYDNKISEKHFTHVVDSRYSEEAVIDSWTTWEYEKY